MSFGKGKIWFDGKLVDWKDANIHILSHALHYGSCVFEGARCYKTKKGAAIFRLDEHIKRLYDSAKIYRMEIPFKQEEFRQAIIDTIKANKYDACYIRPFVWRGYGPMGVNPLENPLRCAVAVWEWGTYLGEGVLEKGISVQVSSWNRFAPNTMPSLAKAAGNYLNSQLVKMEAAMNGFDEGIVLDTNGYVSEGSGENIFVARNSVIYTPPTSASILAGITRHSMFVLARDLGIRIEKHMIPREALYIADEIFFTGTAAEVTPVTKVDNIAVGNGKVGPITKKMQDEFFGIIRGEKEDKHGWLTYV
ncbi:MAG: branched-chain amino acid transaminase [bacterium]